MVSRKLVGAATMILPWPLFLLAATGLGFVSTWMLVVTLVISAYGLTLLISPAAAPVTPASPTSPAGDDARFDTPRPDDADRTRSNTS